MSKKVGRVTNLYNKAKRQLEKNQLEDARDTLDTCLLVLAMETEHGLETIDNVENAVFLALKNWQEGWHLSSLHSEST